MGFDRGVLPPDRDRQETFPWMGVVAAIIILGGIAAAFYFGAFGEAEEPAEIPGSDSRGVITQLL
jgi:hypothetical protein